MNHHKPIYLIFYHELTLLRPPPTVLIQCASYYLLEWSHSRRFQARSRTSAWSATKGSPRPAVSTRTGASTVARNLTSVRSAANGSRPAATSTTTAWRTSRWARHSRWWEYPGVHLGSNKACYNLLCEVVVQCYNSKDFNEEVNISTTVNKELDQYSFGLGRKKRLRKSRADS